MAKGFKRFIRIVANIIMYIFLAVCVFGVAVTLLSDKSDDGAAELFGYQMRVVVSDSMAECDGTDVSEFEIKSIPLHSMVFIQTVPSEPSEAEEWYSSVKVGDVLTFRYVYAKQVTITHRVVSVTEKDGGYIIELAGDNKSSESEQLYQTIDTSIPNNTNYVIGKVVGQSYPLGFAASLLKSPVGIIFIVIVPCFIIILLEVIKIIGVFGEDRKKRERETSAAKDEELERLRRRLSELETSNPSDNDDGDISAEQEEDTK